MVPFYLSSLPSLSNLVQLSQNSKVEACLGVHESEHRDRAHSARDTELQQKARRREPSLTQTENPDCAGSAQLIMVKEEEIIMEAGGRSYMEILGLGEDYFRCMSPSSYFASSVVSTATTSATPAAASPTCASYLDLPPPYHHHMLSFSGQEMCHGDGLFGFQHHGGDRAIPVAVPLPQKTSPTNECSSSISSMSSSPTATAVSAISCAKPQAFKKKGSRAGDQRKVAPDTAANKRPRVRREKLGERILALQQLVSPFGKTDTASVLHEALGYIRFLHDQVQVLSSPYMQRLPPSAHVTGQVSAAGVAAAEHRPADLRSRGLCLVPISCTEHVAGNGGRSSADMWSMAAEMANAAAGSKVAAAATTMRGDHLA